MVSYKELYGWTMDEIVREIGTKNNCTFCGVFRRQVRPRRGVTWNLKPKCLSHPVIQLWSAHLCVSARSSARQPSEMQQISAAGAGIGHHAEGMQVLGI